MKIQDSNIHDIVARDDGDDIAPSVMPMKIFQIIWLV